MKNILHIFAKDARHFWPEILVSMALLCAFVAIEPRTWALRTGLYAVSGAEVMPAFMQAKLLSMLLKLVIPLTWWLVIARVVQAEGLVGDRLFWVTRPYEWKKLLAAKLLFLLLFLAFPLLLTQCLLLMLAGFHPWSFAPALLLGLLLTLCVLLLPVFAITTVTSSFAQLAGVLLAILALFIAYISISLFFFVEASLPGGFVSFPVVVGTSAIVVLLQYATRRVQLARILLLGIPIVVVLIALVVPQAPAVAREDDGRHSGEGNPGALVLRQDPTSHPTSSPRGRRDVLLNIPVQVYGLARGFAAIPNHVQVTVEAADGRHWTSPWQGLDNEHYLPGSGDSNIAVALDRHTYDLLKGAPVKLHFTLALMQVRAREGRTIPLPEDDFFVPDFGICSPQESPVSNRFDGLTCRFAIRQPRLTDISLSWADSPCLASTVAPQTGVTGEAWVGNLENSPGFGISPILIPKLELSNATREEGARSVPRHLCPGTPVTFTQYDPVQSMKYDLTISDFRLPSYQQDEDSSLGAGSVSVDGQ